MMTRCQSTAPRMTISETMEPLPKVNGIKKALHIKEQAIKNRHMYLKGLGTV